MQKLYQRLFGWTRSFSSASSFFSVGRTVHTKVTVERQGVTVLTGGGLTVNGVNICPLCGQALHPSPAAETQLLLEQGSRSQEGNLEGVLREDRVKANQKAQISKFSDHRIDIAGDLQVPPKSNKENQNANRKSKA